jgi:D-alanyl-lipoteichoic acid acyltransferase DltB (MBOAT superfamily)
LAIAEPAPVSPGLIRAFQGVVGLIALLVLVNAILAGQIISYEDRTKDLHAGIGDLTVLLAIAQVVLAYVTRDAWRYKMVIWSVVVLVLVVIQLGLGYSADDSRASASIHIPLGVFIFSFTSINAMLAAMDEKAKAAVHGGS